MTKNFRKITSFYDGYHKQNKNKYFYKVIGKNNFTYYLIIRLISKAIDLKGSPRTILDLGCGVGSIDFFLAKQGFKVDGVDISKHAISIARKFKKLSNVSNAAFFLDDVTTFNNHKKYDLIICSEVIEHIEDDKKLLKNMYLLLEKEGVGVITTPSLNAPLFKIGLLKKFDRKVGHLRRYSSQSLINRVQKVGFEVVYLQKSEGLLRNTLYTIPYLGFLIKFLKGPLVPIFHLIDSFLVKIFGESNIYIIVKKKH